jgi:hypothetical protein
MNVCVNISVFASAPGLVLLRVLVFSRELAVAQGNKKEYAHLDCLTLPPAYHVNSDDLIKWVCGENAPSTFRRVIFQPSGSINGNASYILSIGDKAPGLTFNWLIISKAWLTEHSLSKSFGDFWGPHEKPHKKSVKSSMMEDVSYNGPKPLKKF